MGRRGIWRIDLVIASIFFALGTAIFLVLGAFVALLSKVILAFTLAIGPIAILTLMFRASAKFFDAWLSTVMSAVVLSWFVLLRAGPFLLRCATATGLDGGLRLIYSGRNS